MVAHQRIRTLLEKVDPGNSQQTVKTLFDLVVWYRDILDEELIAAWKRDTRANLTEVMKPLADSRVALAVVEFSWREGRPVVFNLTYTPMLGDLMARFPESAKPVLGDLLGSPPDLSPPEAEAVCRILLDMPDIGTWRRDARQILPHYRSVAESLLTQDLHGSDQDKSYRAQLWLKELTGDVPRSAAARNAAPRSAEERPSPRRRAGVDPTGNQPASDTAPPAAVSRPVTPMPLAAAVPAAPQPYNGARSGTLESSGGPIPQNAEYVFRNMPLVNMKLDYDTKIWDAHLAPGQGQTQKLILRNKSSGPQKRCVVHWSVIP